MTTCARDVHRQHLRFLQTAQAVSQGLSRRCSRRDRGCYEARSLRWVLTIWLPFVRGDHGDPPVALLAAFPFCPTAEMESAKLVAARVMRTARIVRRAAVMAYAIRVRTRRIVREIVA
jgi:hypothetical protein